jgi:hypothetical protein
MRLLEVGFLLQPQTESAKVLYDHKLFGSALYRLQQSNEKLAKGLLLSLGFLTPKTAKKDCAVESVLGFLPKALYMRIC